MSLLDVRQNTKFCKLSREVSEKVSDQDKLISSRVGMMRREVESAT